MIDRYHHGDLPNALRCAAADLITEKGLGGFSLREVARRAGVSHAAPAHHFGDSRGLLTSLAVEALEKLADVTTAASAGIEDPEARLIAIGRAYVDLGLRFPAHCQVAFRGDVVDCDDPTYQAAGERAYRVLEDAVCAVAASENPALDTANAADLLWSAMQGLLVLHPNMSKRRLVHGVPVLDLDTAVTTFTRLIIDGLRAG